MRFDCYHVGGALPGGGTARRAESGEPPPPDPSPHGGGEKSVLAGGFNQTSLLSRSSLRGFGVVRDWRAGADQVAVAKDVVDAADRAPIFVGA